MSIINWSKRYELGIKEIDDQHHNLVNIINKLFDSYNQEAELEIIIDIIDELLAYADIHFGTEEGYFDKFQFEGAAEHRAEHRRFKERINSLKNKLEINKSEVIEDALNILGEWFSDHEEQYDRKYVPCFKKNGLQ